MTACYDVETFDTCIVDMFTAQCDHQNSAVLHIIVMSGHLTYQKKVPSSRLCDPEMDSTELVSTTFSSPTRSDLIC